jgi:mono/diheme cytochrome c family protein
MPRHLSPGKAQVLRSVRAAARCALAAGCVLLAACSGGPPGAPAATPATAPGAGSAPTTVPDAASIAAGKYLAAAGNCLSCHTRPGGAPFAGGLPFPTPLGTLYSTNITPDPATGIGAWTVTDLRRALQQGVNRRGSHLFPVFPYTAFTKFSDADAAALYAFLRTVPAVRYTPPRNGLLFAVRGPVALWNALYFRPGRFVPDPSQTAEWNRGAWLVQGPGHCGACHTPRNRLLAERADRAMQGGTLQVAFGNGARRWSAVDLTPSKRGLGAWSVTDLARYFKTGASARAASFGPMNEVIGNSLSQLPDGDLHAMAVYLKSLPPRAYGDERVPDALAAAGAGVYKARCEKCHGSSGRGGMFSGPPLAASAVVQAEDPASLVNAILVGSDAPEALSPESWETMPAYAKVLDDEQVAAVSNYLRASWGNRGAPVTARMVRAQR